METSIMLLPEKVKKVKGIIKELTTAMTEIRRVLAAGRIVNMDDITVLRKVRHRCNQSQQGLSNMLKPVPKPVDMKAAEDEDDPAIA